MLYMCNLHIMHCGLPRGPRDYNLAVSSWELCVHVQLELCVHVQFARGTSYLANLCHRVVIPADNANAPLQATNHLGLRSFFTTNDEDQWQLIRKNTAQAFSQVGRCMQH